MLTETDAYALAYHCLLPLATAGEQHRREQAVERIAHALLAVARGGGTIVLYCTGANESDDA